MNQIDLILNGGLFLLAFILFGFFLEVSVLGSPRKLIAQFTLRDWTVFKVMFVAIARSVAPSAHSPPGPGASTRWYSWRGSASTRHKFAPRSASAWLSWGSGLTWTPTCAMTLG